MFDSIYALFPFCEDRMFISVVTKEIKERVHSTLQPRVCINILFPAKVSFLLWLPSGAENKQILLLFVILQDDNIDQINK